MFTGHVKKNPTNQKKKKKSKTFVLDVEKILLYIIIYINIINVI